MNLIVFHSLTPPVRHLLTVITVLLWSIIHQYSFAQKSLWHTIFAINNGLLY